VLLGCGLRRAELVRINVEDLQQREGRWVLPDLTGKGNRKRTVTVPAGVKARIDAWLSAAGIATSRIFRSVNKGDVIAGTEIRDEKAVWCLVIRYAQATELGKLAPHDLRRTCAKLCRKAGGELEQIGVWQRFVTNRAISPLVIQAERVINSLFCASRLQRRSLDHPFIVQVIENERRIEMRVERVYRQSLQMAHFVADRCHIPACA
jgi:hypothetical protein